MVLIKKDFNFVKKHTTKYTVGQPQNKYKENKKKNTSFFYLHSQTEQYNTQANTHRQAQTNTL